MVYALTTEACKTTFTNHKGKIPYIPNRFGWGLMLKNVFKQKTINKLWMVIQWNIHKNAKCLQFSFYYLFITLNLIRITIDEKYWTVPTVLTFWSLKYKHADVLTVISLFILSTFSTTPSALGKLLDLIRSFYYKMCFYTPSAVIKIIISPSIMLDNTDELTFPKHRDREGK